MLVAAAHTRWLPVLRVMVTENPWLSPTCLDSAMSGRATTFAEVTVAGLPSWPARIFSGWARLSGSAAQPVRVTVLPLALTFSSAPMGLCAAISPPVGVLETGGGTGACREPRQVVPPAAHFSGGGTNWVGARVGGRSLGEK